MKKLEYSCHGVEVSADLFGIPDYIINDIDYIERVGKEAINISGANILGIQKTNNQIAFLLSESHLTIYLFKNAGVAIVDMYTCGSTCRPDFGVTYIISRLNVTSSSIKTLNRGHEYSISIDA